MIEKTKNFKSLLEFQKHFDTDEKCRLHLEQSRWNGTPACPHCGSINVNRFPNGKNFNCREKQCKSNFTVTVGSMFENSKIPLTKWYLATYILTVHSKGISSLQLAGMLGITQKSSWFLTQRIREMLIEKAPVMLQGEVEADETYVGGKFRNKSKSIRKAMIATSNSHDHKTPVMGLVQRSGKLITFVVPKADRKNVLPLLIETIVPQATLYTDSSHIYTPLKKVFKHSSVNHNQNEYVKGKTHTNTIEGFWSLLKRQIIGIHHNVSPKHLQRYCTEASYRYNNRALTQDEKFAAAISACDGRLKYADLIA